VARKAIKAARGGDRRSASTVLDELVALEKEKRQLEKRNAEASEGELAATLIAISISDVDGTSKASPRLTKVYAGAAGGLNGVEGDLSIEGGQVTRCCGANGAGRESTLVYDSTWASSPLRPRARCATGRRSRRRMRGDHMW